jgi:hypothetical protein
MDKESMFTKDISNVFISTVGKELNTVCYKKWTDIFRRVYDEKVRSKNPSYSGVSVAEDWFNFQNFASWFYDHTKVQQSWQIDKDLKAKREYSSSNCLMLPPKLNGAIRQVNGQQGLAGMYLTNGKYKVQIPEIGTGKQQHLGVYSSKVDAFFAYKQHKEKYVRELANSYKEDLDDEAYRLLMNWEVDYDEDVLHSR